MPLAGLPPFHPAQPPGYPLPDQWWAEAPPPGVIVQAAPANQAASLTTASVTLQQPTGTGNTLIALTSTNGNTTDPTVSGLTLGGAADNWKSAEIATGTPHFDTEIWYDPNCASGQTAVVVNCINGAGANPKIYLTVYEIAGIWAFDQGSFVNGATATTWTSGATSVTTQASEILFGVAMASPTATPTVTGSGNWITQGLSAGAFGQVTGYQIVGATTTATFSGTTASGTSTAAVATFFISSTVSPVAAIAGAGGDTAQPTLSAASDPTVFFGTGTAGGAATISVSAAIAGAGATGLVVPIVGALAPIAGQGVTGNVPTIGGGGGVSGSGSTGTVVPDLLVSSGTQGSGAATSGALAAWMPLGTASGAGVAGAQPTVGALGNAQGAGADITVPAISVSAGIAGAGVAGAASATGGVGTAQGAGGAGAVPTIGVLAAVQGAGTEAGLAGTGVFTGAGIAGAGVTGALPVISAGATVTGAGAAGAAAIVTVFATAAIAGAGVTGAQPTVGASGAVAGAGAVTGTTSVSFIFVNPTAAIAGAGVVAERPLLPQTAAMAGTALLRALAQQEASAALAAAGVTAGTATKHDAAVPATGAATVTDPREGTSAVANGSTGGATVTRPHAGTATATGTGHAFDGYTALYTSTYQPLQPAQGTATAAVPAGTASVH